MKTLLKLFLASFFAFLFLSVTSVSAQTDTTGIEKVEADTSITKTDTVTVPRSQSVEFAVELQARDSMRLDVLKKSFYLYGASKITYGEQNLTADRIDIDQSTGKVHAYPSIGDSAGSKPVGEPVFKDKSAEYKAKEITYNIKTGKGVISGTSTKQGEGIINSERVKKDKRGFLFSSGNIYTTCDLPHPHYGIKSKKMKIVPGKFTASGPFIMTINDVPVPLGFPFGLFPQVGKRASGFVMPQYGETRERGFFLANGGLYWALNDYIDFSLLGDIYTKGGYALRAKSAYKKRYAYDGSLSFDYMKRQVEVAGSLDPDIQNDFSFRWSHSPQTRGTARFSANVNLGTNTYNRRNAGSINDYMSSTMSSNISFSKTFKGSPFSFGANVRHNQNIITKVVDINVPVTFNMRQIYPFRPKGSTKKNLLTQLGVSYSMSGQAKISNVRKTNGSFPFTVAGSQTGDIATSDTLKFNGANLAAILASAQYGMQHRIPISTSMTIAKYFQFGLNANYNETWYPEKYNFTYAGDGTVSVDTLKGFSRYYDFGTGASLSTRIFTTYFPKFFGLQAIRHTMNPSVSLSYRPGFSQEQWGMVQKVQTDSIGTTIDVPLYNGVYGSPGGQESGAISLSIGNTLEAKTRPKSDSVKAEKIQLLNFSLGGGYNMIASEFNFSQFRFSANTSIKKLNISFSANIDPYIYEIQNVNTETGAVTQKRVNKLAWENGRGIGELRSASLAISTNFNQQAQKKYESNRGTDADLNFINAHPELYMDFDIPWNLRINYNISYSKTGFNEANITQSLSFNGDVNLSEKWKVGYNSGYDFKNKAVTATSFNIARDLHCWTLNLNWVPFGPQAGYTFFVGVKAPILSDLKLEKRNSWLYR